MVLTLRIVEYEKRFVLPATQPNPNVPKVYAKVFVDDLRGEVEVYAAWSDIQATRIANITAALKTALDTVLDADNVKGLYTYNLSTKTLVKVT